MDKKINDPSWMKPPQNWVKLNTDASFIGNQDAAIGGAARNSEGTWLWQFNGRIGSTDVYSAELQALRKGLATA